MKILYYLKDTHDYMHDWQLIHIVDELKTNGIEVVIVDPLSFATIKDANEYLVKLASQLKPDLFMTCHGEDLIFIKTINEIKNNNIKTLLICFDNLLIPYYHKTVCKHFDLVWLTSKENSALFKKWGAKIVYLPYACNPRLFECKSSETVNNITFVGNPYGSRANTINYFLDNGIKIDLYGKISEKHKKSKYTDGFIKTLLTNLRFPVGRKIILSAIKQKFLKKAKINSGSPNYNYGGYVESLADAYQTHALCLSSTTARNTGVLRKPVHVVNLRSFEIPMAYGIQFCAYNEELSEMFKDGSEIIFYHSKDDMIKKAFYYLSPDQKELRNKIRINAHERAVRDHTWMKRFDVVFDILGIKKNVKAIK